MKLENTLENKEVVEQFHDEIERKKEDFKNFNFHLLNEDRKVFFMNEKNRLKSIFISKKLYLGSVKSAALTNFYLKGFDFEKNKEITIEITKEQDTFFFYTSSNELIVIDNVEMKNWGRNSIYCLNKINVDQIDLNFELKQFCPFIIFFIIFLLFLLYQGLKFALISLSFMIPVLLAVYSKLFTKEVFLEKYEVQSFRDRSRSET
ncbi:hypothetical protein ACEPKE_003681 [Acinetobacter baumannii]